MQAETISASLPLWVAKIGDRRRLERAWLGWRLAVVDENMIRAEEQMEEAARCAGVVWARCGRGVGVGCI